MLKGRVNTVDIYTQNPLSATEKQIIFPRQDSLLSVKNSSSVSDTTHASQNISTTKKSSDSYSQKQLDSLFIIAEKREKQIIRKINTQQLIVDSTQIKADTTLISNKIPNNLASENQTWQLPGSFFIVAHSGTQMQYDSLNVSFAKNVFATAKVDTIQIHQQETKAGYIEGNIRAESNMNWIVLTVLTSLFIFSWIKSTYEKFIVQMVSGIINYQVSVRLFHERNILFRNVSFALHATFYINLGLFIFYLIENFGYTQLFPNNFLSMFTYSIAFFILYSIKLLSGKIISYIFLFQEEFAEYIHNVFLFNKNIGLLLFPIIIIYPFIAENIKPLLIYTGLILIIIMLLLRMYRGFQIIMRKGVNMFYLILYLCAVEILPVLLLVKVLNTLI
jgi:hypothetical protein